MEDEGRRPEDTHRHRRKRVHKRKEPKAVELLNVDVSLDSGDTMIKLPTRKFEGQTQLSTVLRATMIIAGLSRCDVTKYELTQIGTAVPGTKLLASINDLEPIQLRVSGKFFVTFRLRWKGREISREVSALKTLGEVAKEVSQVIGIEWVDDHALGATKRIGVDPIEIPVNSPIIELVKRSMVRDRDVIEFFGMQVSNTAQKFPVLVHVHDTTVEIELTEYIRYNPSAIVDLVKKERDIIDADHPYIFEVDSGNGGYEERKHFIAFPGISLRGRPDTDQWYFVIKYSTHKKYHMAFGSDQTVSDIIEAYDAHVTLPTKVRLYIAVKKGKRVHLDSEMTVAEIVEKYPDRRKLMIKDMTESEVNIRITRWNSNGEAIVEERTCKSSTKIGAILGKDSPKEFDIFTKMNDVRVRINQLDKIFGNMPEDVHSFEIRPKSERPADDENICETKISDVEVDFNSYEKVKSLGKGAQGSVALYKEKCGNNQFAVKSAYPDYRTELVHESVILASLSHPCIVPFMGQCTHNGKFYMFTRYVPHNLKSIIMGIGDDDECQNTDKAKILMSIVLAMEYVHTKNYIHRDLKPDNILIDDNYNVSLCDFGVSKQVNKEKAVLAKTLTGTPLYMAPEVWHSDDDIPYDNKADVYSFGLIWYELMTGEHPYTRFIKTRNKVAAMSVAGNNVKRPKPPASLTDDLKGLMEACWDARPEMRPSFRDIREIMQNNKYMIAPDVESAAIEDYINEILAQVPKD